MNINDDVKVRLTPYGKEIHDEYCMVAFGFVLNIQMSEDHYCIFKLRNLMAIFGTRANNEIFQNNEVITC